MRIFVIPHHKWCVLVAGVVVLFFLDTVLQYNIISSIFRDSNTPPLDNKPNKEQQVDILTHPRHLQQVEDEFFEVKLKQQIDLLNNRINISSLYKPELPALRFDFSLKELFGLKLGTGHHNPEEDKKPKQILFTSYLRGGASMLVDLVTKQRDSFYVPEPIWTVTPFGYFTADNYMCNSKTGSCRPLKRTVYDSDEEADYEMKMLFRYAKRKEYPLESVLRILENILTCSFDEGFDGLLLEDLPYSDTGHTLQQYISCRRGPNKSDCLDVLTSTCKEHNFRVIKALRLTLAAVEVLLETNPDVKVVHLFRDPRAIIASRLYNADWYHLQTSPRDPSISQNARALCQKMRLDYKRGIRLMQLFPDRFRFARYEDLMSHVRDSRKSNLLKFLKIEPDVTKFDIFKNGLQWRNRMSFNDMRVVDSECHEVYADLGYLTFKSNDRMRNLNIESFVPL